MSSCTHCVRATIEAFFFASGFFFFGFLCFRMLWPQDSSFRISLLPDAFCLRISSFRISLLPDALASRFFFSDFLASGCFLPQDFFFSDFLASGCFGLRISSFCFSAEFRGRLFAALLIYEKEKLIADLRRELQAAGGDASCPS